MILSMIPIDTLAAFFMASVLLALAPGPDNIFVLTQSALRGKSAGLLVTLGLCTGLLVHTTAVAFGVAVIFQASAVAFTALKLFGAAYLLYLAWHAFRASSQDISAGRSNGLSAGRLYRRGIIMNVTNPKVSIFFMAFLPQFADPARGPLSLQMLLLGGVFIVSTILVFGGIALMAGSIGQWLTRSPKTQGVMNRVAGLVFVGLAVKLATVKR
ncbi:membrane protein [Desulfosarcina widdelii]|uniref:Membrane protein n=1 Tax=Desulfosarcina widdelii TaxID=947919 RepID=A0A5K7Z6C2_9BACT|nr:LysE family translocator [Desulfosarcina widdelii]BBO75749.1 membrane protein [Desulfosarcina widdelii]